MFTARYELGLCCLRFVFKVLRYALEQLKVENDWITGPGKQENKIYTSIKRGVVYLSDCYLSDRDIIPYIII